MINPEYTYILDDDSDEEAFFKGEPIGLEELVDVINKLQQEIKDMQRKQ